MIDLRFTRFFNELLDGSPVVHLLKQILSEQQTQTRLLRHLVPRTVSIKVNVTISGTIQTGVSKLQIKDNQQFSIILVPEDAKGNPSQIDPTKTTFTIDNANLATLTPAGDGVTCAVVAAGPVGSAQIQFSVTDANNPADVVTGTLPLTVVGGDTAQLIANTTPVTDQPVAPAKS